MDALIDKICKGNSAYELIIRKSLQLHQQNQTMTFRELIDFLNSKGIYRYRTSIGISRGAIMEIFRRSIYEYRNYDKEGDFDKKDKADMICEAVAFAYTRNNGDIAWL